MSIINTIKEATLTALFTLDTVGDTPVSLENESYVLDSKVDVSLRYKLQLIDHVKPGHLCSALDDLDAIGNGIAQMTVR